MAVVPMRPWMLMSVTLNLRAPDREDFAAFGIEDLERWACQRALSDGAYLTCLNANGIPVSCFGIIDTNGIGTAWIASTEEAPHHKIEIYKAFKKLVAANLFRQIEAVCRTDRPGIMKYFDWLGFHCCGTIPRHLTTGGSATLFVLETS